MTPPTKTHPPNARHEIVICPVTKHSRRTRRSGSRHRWDGGELVDNAYMKYHSGVLHLARFFCLLFAAMAKSKSGFGVKRPKRKIQFVIHHQFHNHFIVLSFSRLGMKIGIVGLPNVGKSTLFNALTKSYSAPAENFPFCTIDPNIGIVDVKDPRVDKLSEISQSKKKVYASIEFVDIAGLVKGASKGEGLGNKFLSHIREVDAIVQVLRYFKDSDVVHVE